MPAGTAAGSDAAPATTVAVLDTGIDFNHPSLASSQGGPGFDVLSGHAGVDPGHSDEHGTNVAGGVITGAGGSARLVPYRVLDERPVLGGFDAVVGTSDDLVAGLEHAVDPNNDGAVDDAPDVALIALAEPYGGFADTVEEQAVDAADALGVVTVAAAGNDGDSHDEVGTIAAPASATNAIAVGAADLREQTSRADLHIRGGIIDEVLQGAPLVTQVRTLPKGRLSVVAISGQGDDVVHYLGADARSRVAGEAVLLDRINGVSLAAQVRAAADAGAVAVIVSGASGSSTAGAVTAPGVTIPALGIDRAHGQAIRDVLDGDTVTVTIAARQGENAGFGHVSGFSSRGPRFDGTAKPDLVSTGVAVQTTSAGRTSSGGERYTSVSGTSIAAAYVAGQVASLRGRHPMWTPSLVRAAVVGTAAPLGDIGDRDPLEAQGAGVLQLDAAGSATTVASPPRIDFGALAAGASKSIELRMIGTRAGATFALPTLLLEREHADGPTPVVSGGRIVMNVPGGTRPGVYGGWLVDSGSKIRIPWSVVVRSAAEMTVPVQMKLDRNSLRVPHRTGVMAASARVSVGGTRTDGSLGIRGIQHAELHLTSARGKDLGTVGRLDWRLPGVYTFGITGRGRDGAPLAAGRYRLELRYIAAASPDAKWQGGPSVSFRVERRR